MALSFKFLVLTAHGKASNKSASALTVTMKPVFRQNSMRTDKGTADGVWKIPPRSLLLLVALEFSFHWNQPGLRSPNRLWSTLQFTI